MKFKLTASLLLCFLCMETSFGQWTKVTLPSANTLYVVEYASPTLIGIGGIDGLIITTNGGGAWTVLPLKDNNNLPLYGSSLYTMHFFDDYTAVASGSIATSNSEVILRTTNGGVNWSSVNVNNAGNWPREIVSLFFVNSSTGFGSGSNGRVLKTINAGVNWTPQTTPVTGQLYKIFFTDALHGYAAGKDAIIRTNDGGNTWTSTGFAGKTFSSICFPTSSIGYACGPTGLIKKTTDGGDNWSDLALPVNVGFADIAFTSQDTGYGIAGKTIYRTTNGGILWERSVLSVSTDLKSIDFLNSTHGFVAGTNGAAYSTSNGGGPYAPIANFTTSTTTICPDSIIYFSNTGPNTYSYQWQLNGVTFSTSHDASYTFHNANQQDTVSLVAFNGVKYDTMKTFLFVQPSLEFTLSVSAKKDSICPGNVDSIYVNNSTSGVTYQLKKGNTNIGSTEFGTTGTRLAFWTGVVNATTTFTIEAYKSNSCGTLYKYADCIVTVPVPIPGTPVSVSLDSVCRGDTASILIGSSEPSITYQLRSGTTNIGSPVKGNGSMIWLPAGKVNKTTIYNVVGTSSLGCTGTLSTQVTIVDDSIHAGFRPSPINAFVGDTITMLDSSVATETSWQFDANANPAASTLYTPQVTYSNAATHTVHLNVANATGCKDSLVQTVDIFEHAPTGTGTLCYADTIPSIYRNYCCGQRVLASCVDKRGNYYVTGYYYNDYKFGSYVLFLHKYNKDGNLVWSKVQDPWSYSYSQDNYSSTVGSSMAVDTVGNIYLGGTFGAFKFKLDTITVTSPNAASQGFVARLDSNGKAQWMITMMQGAGSSASLMPTDILYKNDGSIFVGTYGNFGTIKFINGQSYILADRREAHILEINASGNMVKITGMGNLYNGSYSSAILGIYNPDRAGYYTSKITGGAPKLKMNSKGNLVVTGFFRNMTVDIGPFTLDTLGKNENFFIAIMDPANGFQKAFTAFGAQINTYSEDWDHLPVFDIDKDDNIVVGYNLNYINSYVINSYLKLPAGVVIETGNGSHLIKYNENGDVIWNNRNGLSRIAGLTVANDNSINAYGEYYGFLGLRSQNIPQKGVKTSNSYNCFISSYSAGGDLNWVNTFDGGVYGGIAISMIRDHCDNLFFSGVATAPLNILGDSVKVNANIFIGKFSPFNNCGITGCQVITSFGDKMQHPQHRIHIYPNPATGKLTISGPFEKSTIQVLNMTGETMYLSSVYDFTSTIDVSGFPSGIYFVKIAHGSTTLAERFAKP